MSTHTFHPDREEFYFITITCYKWLNLLEMTNLYDYIYKWFDILMKNLNHISGYVIMPNHIHLLIFQTQKSPLLNRLVANGKRFLAYEIIRRLEKMEDYETLQYLAKKVPPRERKIGKKHQAFQPSFDARLCFSNEMIEQKLDYIHMNPMSKKWELAESYLNYKHSSARFYEFGERPEFGGLIHYMDISNPSESTS
jgi:REP element-mobilizing transposase RayT